MMKRFLLFFLFLPLSFASAQLCSISACESETGLSCVQEGRKIYSSVRKFNEERALSNYLRDNPQYSNPAYRLVFSSNGSVISIYSASNGSLLGQAQVPYDASNYDFDYHSKSLFCSVSRPDISSPGWCKSGYSSPIHIPNPSMLQFLGGRPVIRLICDDPYMNDLVYYDSWEDYAANRNPKFMADNKTPGADGGSGGSGAGSEGGGSGSEGGGSGSEGGGSGSEGGGSGSEGGGSGSEGGGSDGGNGLSQTTLEDILHAINFAASNSTKAGIDAINFSNDAIAKAVRDGIDSSSIGSGGSAGSGGSGGSGSGEGEGEGDFPDGLLTEDYIDGLLSDFISGSENIDDSEVDSVNVESIDVAQFNKTYNVKLLASKQCPAPIPISFSMFGHAYNYYLTFDYLCMFAEVVGKLLLAAAYFSAAFIVARVSRR